MNRPRYRITIEDPVVPTLVYAGHCNLSGPRDGRWCIDVYVSPDERVWINYVTFEGRQMHDFYSCGHLRDTLYNTALRRVLDEWVARLQPQNNLELPALNQYA